MRRRGLRGRKWRDFLRGLPRGYFPVDGGGVCVRLELCWRTIVAFGKHGGWGVCELRCWPVLHCRFSVHELSDGDVRLLRGRIGVCDLCGREIVCSGEYNQRRLLELRSRSILPDCWERLFPLSDGHVSVQLRCI